MMVVVLKRRKLRGDLTEFLEKIKIKKNPMKKKKKENQKIITC